MATQTKPNNEIVIAFGKDSDNCIIVTLFDVHGEQMQAAVIEAGFGQTRLAGKDAIKQTGKIGTMVKALGLTRKAFVAKGHQYFSYTMPA